MYVPSITIIIGLSLALYPCEDTIARGGRLCTNTIDCTSGAQLAFSSGNWSGRADSVAYCAMHLGFIDLGTWKLASLTSRKVDPSTISPFVLSSSGKYKEPKMASKTI